MAEEKLMMKALSMDIITAKCLQNTSLHYRAIWRAWSDISTKRFRGVWFKDAEAMAKKQQLKVKIILSLNTYPKSL